MNDVYPCLNSINNSILSFKKPSKILSKISIHKKDVTLLNWSLTK
jgi:hypothetical protein